MKKKTVKKLVLAKETLIDLESGLPHVAAAATAAAACISGTGCGAPACPWSGYRTCNTCGATCGTNLC
jgi:hypothetical protein